MGSERRKASSFVNITLINGKALPESLKGARHYMSVSLSICEKSLYFQTPFFYEAI